MLSTRFHGIVSLALVGIAVIVAIFVLVHITWGWAVGYGLLCLLGMTAIIYTFCAKCPCQQCCAHVLPGKVARLFPRAPSPYSGVEQAVVVVAIALILGLPQLWLWQNVAALVVFWILNAVAVTQILIFVCRVCANFYCPVRKWRSGIRRL
ncbi:MAG: hypothetical protein JXA33_13800 [Anaerolineae bacterium]|nr:hypothetical protein [Anaerolineae bacterium]